MAVSSSYISAALEAIISSNKGRQRLEKSFSSTSCAPRLGTDALREACWHGRQVAVWIILKTLSGVWEYYRKSDLIRYMMRHSTEARKRGGGCIWIPLLIFNVKRKKHIVLGFLQPPLLQDKAKYLSYFAWLFCCLLDTKSTAAGIWSWLLFVLTCPALTYEHWGTGHLPDKLPELTAWNMTGFTSVLCQSYLNKAKVWESYSMSWYDAIQNNFPVITMVSQCKQANSVLYYTFVTCNTSQHQCNLRQRPLPEMLKIQLFKCKTVTNWQKAELN